MNDCRTKKMNQPHCVEVKMGKSELSQVKNGSLDEKEKDDENNDIHFLVTGSWKLAQVM